MSAKRAAREAARARLRSLPAERRAVLGARAAECVWSVPEIESARVLLLFASMPEEVPTDTVAAEARQRGIETVYPRSLLEDRRLALHVVRDDGDLKMGAFAIREPAAGCASVAVEEVDVALIPGLAWDRHGGRLGRGAGYYDRLLAEPGFRALRCGLFFSIQEAADLPADPWDQPLDLVVTETEVWRRGRI